jgi:threonine synthase
LTDFINTGVYDRNRAFHTTTSPSMDILISSNLERLLYLLCGENDEIVKNWFGQLSENGKYTVDSGVLQILQDEFYGGFCDDKGTEDAIGEIFKKYQYLCDTHTAVAVKVYEEYKEKTGDTTKTIIASTANPYKFSKAVLSAIEEKSGENSADEFENIDKINQISGLEIPKSLAELKSKTPIYTDSINKEDMSSYVISKI